MIFPEKTLKKYVRNYQKLMGQSTLLNSSIAKQERGMICTTQ